MTIFCKGENYAACKNCIACVVDYGCNRVRCRAKGVEITSIAYEDNRYCDRWVSRTWMQAGAPMTGAGGPLGRDGVAFEETMQRHFATMEKALYAAEQKCGDNGGIWSCPPACPFEQESSMFSTKTKRCVLESIRELIGDHIIHHDVMPQVPQCQCGGKCHQ